MPRRRVTAAIPDARERARALERRRKGLLKSANQLATLCGVPVAVAVAAPGGAPTVWESEPGVVARYRALPAAKRARHTLPAYAVAEVQRAERRVERAGRAGARVLELGDAAIEGMGAEEVRALLAAIDAAALAAEERRKALVDAAALPLLPAAAGLDQDGVDEPSSLGQVEDMDAWIDELMWDGVEELLPMNMATETAAQQPECSSGGLQHVGTTGADDVYMRGHQRQMQMPGSNGGDHGSSVGVNSQQRQLQMPGGGNGNSWFTGGDQHQYQHRGATAFPGQRGDGGGGGGFPCSFNNVNHGFHRQSNGSASIDISSRNSNSIAAAPPVGYPYAPRGNFAGAPPAAFGIGRNNSMCAMSYRGGFPKQGVPGHYPYGTNAAAAGFFQMQAPSNNHAWPIINPQPAYGQFGSYSSMNGGGVVGTSSYTPAPAESVFGSTARGAVGTGSEVAGAANGFDDYAYDASCFLASGDDDFRYPDDDDTGVGFQDIGLEQLNYFSDVADGLVVF